MNEPERKDRRRFLRSCGEIVGYATVLPLVAACTGEEKPGPGGGSAASKPAAAGSAPVALPDGVKWDLENKHTPRCTLSADGEDWVVDVVVRHVVNKTHYISGVKFVGPDAPFAEVAVYAYPQEQIDAADDKEWKHVFRIPKSSVPAGARHLVVYSHCNKHGNYAMSQGFLG